jgi:hypothetical protein
LLFGWNTGKAAGLLRKAVKRHIMPGYFPKRFKENRKEAQGENAALQTYTVLADPVLVQPGFTED